MIHGKDSAIQQSKAGQGMKTYVAEYTTGQDILNKGRISCQIENFHIKLCQFFARLQQKKGDRSEICDIVLTYP
jgi:hypothetical protein